MSLVAAIDAAVAFAQPERGYLYQRELAEFRELARTVCVLAREQGLEHALPKAEELERRLVWFPRDEVEASYGRIAFHSQLHLPGHYSYEYRHLKAQHEDGIPTSALYPDEVFVPVLAEWLDVLRMLRELAGKPGTPPTEDESAYRPAKKLVEERFDSYRIGKCFLDHHPEIRTKKPSPYRLLVHAGDWHKYWARQQKEPTDEAVEAYVEGIEARKQDAKHKKHKP